MRLDIAKYVSTQTLTYPSSVVLITSLYDPQGSDLTFTVTANDQINAQLSTQPGGQIGQGPVSAPGGRLLADTRQQQLKGRRLQDGSSAIVGVTVYIPPSNIDPNEDPSQQLDAYLLVGRAEVDEVFKTIDQ